MAVQRCRCPTAGGQLSGSAGLSVLLCLCSLLTLTASQNSTGCGALPSGQICCGGRQYDVDKDRVCCSLPAYSGDQAYLLRNGCDQGLSDNPFEYCRDRQFDSRYEGCCGHTVFNRQHSQCCPGSRMSTVVKRGTVCCNGEGLQEGEMCCQTSFGDVALNKAHPDHTDCCYEERHRLKTFNPSTHYCDTDGQVWSIPEQGKGRHHRSSQSSSPRNQTQDPPLTPESVLKREKTRRKRFGSSSMLSDYVNRACLEGREREEEGEQLECCDLTPFRPSRQTCCKGVLHNLPSSTSRCCSELAYDLHDTSNPCLGSCGGHPLNLDTQICCKDKVFNTSTPNDFCCGASPVNPDTHDCCGGMSVKKGRWRCCQNTMPYLPQLMRCHRQTATVTLRQGQLKKKKQSIPQKFCSLSLDTWGERWRSFVDPNMVKVEGRVVSCDVKIKKGKLTIPLSPAVAVVGGEAVSSCLTRKGLKLVVVLPDKMACSRKKVRQYLKGQTLELMVKGGELRCKRGRVEVREGDVALVLRSRKMDLLLEDALQSGS